MKFAQVGYGSDGNGAGRDGKGYTYLVSDSFRTGDKIQPIVHHYKNNAIFSTHGKVLSTGKGTILDDKVLKIVDGKVVGITTKTLTYQGRAKEMGLNTFSKQQKEAFAGMNILNTATNPNNKSKISQGEVTLKNIATANNTTEKQAQQMIDDFNKGI